MKGFGRLLLCLCAIACLLWLGGCEDKPISLRYDRPAAYEIPASVKRIAVAEFGGTSAEDKKYGNIAADQVASLLDEFNKKYNRYQLVDRKRLRAILDERDMQMAISDSASAAEVGKLADVEGMIYGSVNVAHRDEQASRTSFDISSRMPKTIHYTKRYCMASVNFTLDDISTGKTLTTVTATREYDSDKDSKGGASSLTKAMGFSSDNLPPPEQVLNRLIGECVEEFVQKISPHTIEVSVKMEKGKSKVVETGNKLARAGEYAEAMELYRQAVEAKGDDDGAMFDLGLMCEATRDFTQAEQWYSKAFALKDNEKYSTARARVRKLLEE